MRRIIPIVIYIILQIFKQHGIMSYGFDKNTKRMNHATALTTNQIIH